ncbi:glycosyl transferase family 2 [Syntrophobotulus glycolicus DSM 8271]|uniref:Glycosyl transferase family 2 n=1 Tax=Syntrophobotulus glycolicus (strain DSM 8271 / FlGlyR) TaxID=645991 RepID=F0SZC8_SYNGF|nr:glycosyltransferase [Syntrophobotulus glycolicus]ADY54933.1 glycosyl transferase family 2 [Syntrophobotulus glycolicus DSM 8271]
MNTFVEPIILNTDSIEAPKVGNDLYTSRKNVYNELLDANAPTASIIVQAYNRLGKTKRCVENILKYTTDVSFELILVDNGSTDGTYEFFQSVDYHDKKIVRVTKNVGAAFPSFYLYNNFKGKYFVIVSNDIVVTHHWLSNLLTCFESDVRIGMVIPLSSNVSNLQDPGWRFDSLEEMEEVAKEYNHSNSLKWKERMRLITTIVIFSREILDIVGKTDAGYFHDFAEDDLAIRIRRAGYKLILCEDTYIHHDHDFRNMEDKDPVEFQNSLNMGRQNYKDKYHGLDAWDDVNNFERPLINMLPQPSAQNNCPQILGVDIRMGTPILEIKNKLRESGVLKTRSSAFTTKAIYYSELATICDGEVYSDRIDAIQEHFEAESFDYLILGEPVNLYPNPLNLIKKLLSLIKKGGKLLIKLRNTNDVRKLFTTLGRNDLCDTETPVDILIDDFIKILGSFRFANVQTGFEMHNIDKNIEDLITALIEGAQFAADSNESIVRLTIKDYLFYIEK